MSSKVNNEELVLVLVSNNEVKLELISFCNEPFSYYLNTPSRDIIKKIILSNVHLEFVRKCPECICVV